MKASSNSDEPKVVHRYTMDEGERPLMLPQGDGRYVLYSDYAHEVTRRDKLAGEVETMTNNAVYLSTRFDSVEAERDKLLAALEDYGRHQPLCKTHRTGQFDDCGCGLRLALRGEEAKNASNK